MKQQKIMWLGTVVVLSCCFISGLAYAVAEIPAAKIVSLKGTGQVRQEHVQQWHPAAINQGVFAGNYVRTGDLSRMALLFSDQTQLSLNQNSQLQIKQVRDQIKNLNTAVRLNQGRSWTQSRQASQQMIMETPSAIAAIRGTDWDMEVDERGKSTITVLSGEVEFYNEQGKVTVRKNEQASAEVGKAPVKIIITNPRNRVQWVSQYTVETLRHIYLRGGAVEDLRQDLEKTKGDDPVRGSILADLGQWEKAEQAFRAALEKRPDEPGALLGMGYVELHRGDTGRADSYFSQAQGRADEELLILGQAASMIQGENFRAGLNTLQKLIASPELKQPAAYLIVSDLMMYGGEFGKAVECLEQAGQRFPGNPRIAAQIARVQLFADQPDESRNQIQIALKQTPKIIDAYLNLGALAKQQGDAKGAESAYMAAIALKPEDDRGWYGMGAVNSEKEEVKAGRSNLNQALAINARGAGYRGELATLETFANNFEVAEAEYRKALQDNPGDYIALTGLGLLELKRGNTQEALESFLKASVIEPRYARVHMYTAVAYYQLGYTDRALEKLTRAKELDIHDPFPYMLAGMIYGDHFEAGKAVEEGREALRRMPYLKSLNQIANDQKGSANLGSALAFFGLEEWAFKYAQESYYPFWGGSHLFLADRYPNLFNKNSELFQGYLVDPTAFGGSNRFQTLLPKPGNYFSTGVRSGYQEEYYGARPFFTANGYSNANFPLAYFLDAGYTNIQPEKIEFRADSANLTAALGANPIHDIGLFAFTTMTDTYAKFLTFPMTERFGRIDIGGHYKISPTSQFWVKVGVGNDTARLTGDIPEGGLIYEAKADARDFQFRNIFSLGEDVEFSWGVEFASVDKPQFLAVTMPDFPDNSVTNSVTNKDSSQDVYMSGRFKFSRDLLLQTDLYRQRFNKKAYTALGITGYPETFIRTDKDQTETDINKRLGLVYSMADARQLIRMAYQEWTRPASVSTLSSVTTAGIPLDDQLVAEGGRLTRFRLQMESEWTPRIFTTLFADQRKIKNGPVEGIQSSYLDGLDKLNSNRLINVASIDRLEGTPTFNEGKAFLAGISLNHILNPRWSLYSRYVYTDSELTGDRLVDGYPIPYLARHTVTLGTTWTGPQRLFLNVLAIWRDDRYAAINRSLRSDGTVEDNSAMLKAGWNAGIRAYWETRDKHWSFDGGVANIFSNNESVSTYYGIDVKYRF